LSPGGKEAGITRFLQPDRMRAFQGSFHANPDYALWYGWSEMQRDLTEIKALAKEMKESHKK
jgi:hydroxylamine dehydrogenase